MYAIVAKLNNFEKCIISDETQSLEASQFVMAANRNLIFAHIKRKQFCTGQKVLCLSDMMGRYFDIQGTLGLFQLTSFSHIFFHLFTFLGL